MTFAQSISLFESIATAHQQIHGFGHGELWEIENTIKPGLEYPLLFAVPIDSTTTEHTQQRKFRLLVCKMLDKDKTNQTEVLSDTEQIFNDVVKILRNESTDYNLLGDPVLEYFTEDFGDWLAGCHAEIVLETPFANNYCDIPASNINSPVVIPGFAVIRRRDTNEVVSTLTKGQTYYIDVLETVEQSLDTVTPTIIQILT